MSIKFDKASITRRRNGKTIEVFNEISFNIARGSICAIAGHLGCGKSALLAVINGDEKISGGDVSVFGKKNGKKSCALIESADSYGNDAFKTVLENTEASPSARKTKSHLKLDMLLAKSGLAGHENDLTGRLSAELQLNTALTRAFMKNNDIILLNEPFAFMDKPAASRAKDYIRLLRDLTKKTVIFTTHDAESALQLSDRIILISGQPGEIIETFEIEPDIKRNSADVQFNEIRGKIKKHADKLSGLHAKKQNCWEFKKCGREPGGAKAPELGICPAAIETSLAGINGGTNSGRACWIVAGTFCKGEVQGTFANKLKNCEQCDFYRSVKQQEGEPFGHIETLLSYLRMNEDTEKRKYRTILNNMVDPAVVSEAMNDLASLKHGSEKNITAFFSDIASFSEISEKLSSAELAQLLNEYLSAMTEILKSEHGTLDKYIGDAIVGIFGAPIDLPDNALSAVRTAVKMKDRLETLRAKWKREGRFNSLAHEMTFRIGINTGKAKVGFMGTDKLASYTMIGSNVNIASWLESAGKIYGTTILASESTARLSQHEYYFRFIDSVHMKGRDEAVKIYELVGPKKDVEPAVFGAAALYEEGYGFFLDKKWDEAIQKFTESEIILGGSFKPARLLIERCELFRKESAQKPLAVYEKVKGEKKNCWEFKKCGREPGGAKTAELGVCPASTENILDGIHDGKNSGRACWVVAGTFCKGEIQGTYANKFSNCKNCDFYLNVKREEFPRFKLIGALIKLLRNEDV